MVAAHINLPTVAKVVSGPQVVQLFYIISGVYMALVLTQKYKGSGSTRRFWASRYLLLWPAYLCTAAFTIVRGLLLAVAGPPFEFLNEWRPHATLLTPDKTGAFLPATPSCWVRSGCTFSSLERVTGDGISL